MRTIEPLHKSENHVIPLAQLILLIETSNMTKLLMHFGNFTCISIGLVSRHQNKFRTIRLMQQASVQETLQEGLDTTGRLLRQQDRRSESRFSKEVRDAKTCPSMIDESCIWKHSVFEFENGMSQGLFESNSSSAAVYPVGLDTSRSKDDFADIKEMMETINQWEAALYFGFVCSLGHDRLLIDLIRNEPGRMELTTDICHRCWSVTPYSR